MTLSITPETKNTLVITNVAKGSGLTWDQATYTEDSTTAQSDTWNEQGKLIVTAETKNALSITNETKL